MTEVDLAYNWIETTLSGDSTLQGYAPGGVYQAFALPGTAAPYALVKFLSGKDNRVFGGGNAYSDMRFRVTVSGPIAAQTAIEQAAARIDTLLKVAAQIAVTGGTISASFRDQEVNENEWVDGQKWQVDGGEYRVFAKAS